MRNPIRRTKYGIINRYGVVKTARMYAQTFTVELSIRTCFSSWVKIDKLTVVKSFLALCGIPQCYCFSK